MDDFPPIEPLLLPREREELICLADFLARLEAMRARDLVSADAYATLVSETEARREALERIGRSGGMLDLARKLGPSRPDEALTWADQARHLAPERQEAWVQAIKLLRRLDRRDEALALCAEAAERFPGLQSWLDEVRREEEARKAQAPVPSGALERARQALQGRRDDEVIALCAPLLEAQPDLIDALVLTAFAHQRLGHLDDALALYRRLRHLQPGDATWEQWVRHVQQRLARSKTAAGTLERRSDRLVVRGEAAEPHTPAFAWSSIAREFLQEHWQKLILSLAVLLIVVSSTVGAHALLGPRLWSPAGKCTLALVYTVMFAAFGVGLVRWGAERAGRMMLITTLIVIPINFMLAGEMRLLIEPSPSRLAVLALDAVGLVLLTRLVTAALDLRAGRRFLTLALVALGAFNAATAPGIPLAWGYAALLAPPWIFLGAVWWLNTRYRGETVEEHRAFVYFALGLLGFAFLSGELRTGAFVLTTVPALFAVPVMLTAIACVHSAHHLARFEKEPRRVVMMRVGGLVLSGLAFALALARPPVPSPLYSGNTLAVAGLGLALYGAMLRAYRQPVYLYLAFGALFLGYFGAYDFAVDLIRAVEDSVRQALGYRQKLPIAFKSLNGLVFNTLLALLSLWFARRWEDERLAHHCHYLGLPVSIAACILGCFEPKAAVLCLSGYSVLYALAVWLFLAPRVVYLACAAMAGAAFFGAMLTPGLSEEAIVLGAVLLGFVFWLIRTALEFQGWDRSYWMPLVHSALVLAVGALAAATVAVPPAPPDTITEILACLVAGLLCALLVADIPRRLLAHLAIAGWFAAWLGGFALATSRATPPAGSSGIAIICYALVLLMASEWVLRWGSIRAVVFSSTLPDFALGLVLLADVLVPWGLNEGDFPSVLHLLIAGAVALFWLTRFRRAALLVYLGLAQAVAAALWLSAWRTGWGNIGFGLGWLALTSAVAALTLWGIGVACRREGVGDFYVVPCFRMSGVLAAIVFALALNARLASIAAFPMSPVALVVNTLTLVALTTVWRRPELTLSALLAFVCATYVTLFSVGKASPDAAYILGLAAVVEALLFWALGFVCLRRLDKGGDELYASPLFVASLILTLLAVPPALTSAVTMLLVACSLVLMIKSFPASEWLYLILGALGCAVYDVLLEGTPRYWWIATAMVAAYGLWSLGLRAERVGPRLCTRLQLPELDFTQPFFNMAALMGLIAVMVRIDESLNHGVPWTAYAGLPIGLGAFCILMIKAYPSRAWVHAAMALVTLGLAIATYVLVGAPGWWLLVIMVLAIVCSLASRGLRRVEPAHWRRLGVADVDGSGVVRAWSLAFFAVAAVLTGSMVVLATLATNGTGQELPTTAVETADWTGLLLTLLATGTYLVIEGPRFGDVDDVRMGLLGVLTLVVWWLGVPGSPLRAGLRLDATTYYPVATAVEALAIVALAARPGGIRGGESEGSGGERSGRFASFASRAGFVLALVALVPTTGAIQPTTIVALLLATATFAVLALARGWTESAYAAGLAWSAACLYGALEIRRWRGQDGTVPETLAVALGACAAVFSLWGMALRLGRTVASMPEGNQGARGRVVRALEQVAWFASLVATGAVASLTLDSVVLGQAEALVGVGVLFGVALFDILLARRWGAAWLIYMAQAMLLGAYLDYRYWFPLPTATDAALLTLFGFLDFGLGEVMQRLRLTLYARPTLSFALVLPLIPLVQALWAGRLDEVNLFLLFATATFYAVACYTRQWKTPGYAAAVFYNALLWLAWARVGWQLADHPQFFLIPVGLSAILFAEVNRRALGRSYVNALRALGLIVVYLSLAVPIWQFQSFGAWLTLLLLSLAGILVGIGLRVQSFLWLGLVGFVLDVVYQLGRVGAEYALAKWAIMLALGIVLILFVALNEKKRILESLRAFYEQARQWE